jgi:hypothetical protein
MPAGEPESPTVYILRDANQLGTVQQGIGALPIIV